MLLRTLWKYKYTQLKMKLTRGTNNTNKDKIHTQLDENRYITLNGNIRTEKHIITMIIMQSDKMRYLNGNKMIEKYTITMITMQSDKMRYLDGNKIIEKHIIIMITMQPDKMRCLIN